MTKVLMRHILRVFLLVGVAAGVAHPSPAQDSTTSYDPSRIVSIGGDVTEVLFELGLGDSVVAVDTTSVFPQPAVSQRKSVGYMRALSSEGVLAVGPTLILATDTAGPPEVVAALKASSVPFVTIESPDTPEGVQQKIERIAKIVGKDDAGRTLASRVNAAFEAAAHARAQITKPVRALFLMSVQSGRALAGGRHTGADAMFALAGAENVIKDFDGYKPLSGEAALGLAPEVIVVMQSAPGHGMAAATSQIAAEIAAVQGLADTPAVKGGRIIEYDGSLMLQFGPRAPKAAQELMHYFYPNAVSAPETR